MTKFLTSNDARYRLGRTIVQGVLAWLIQYLADILDMLNMSAETVAIVTPLIMAVLSPVMAQLGEWNTVNVESLDDIFGDDDDDIDEEEGGEKEWE